jgi:hypothetical protein
LLVKMRCLRDLRADGDEKERLQRSGVALIIEAREKNAPPGGRWATANRRARPLPGGTTA